MSAGTRAASGETRLKPDSARTSRSRSASTIRPMRRCRPSPGFGGLLSESEGGLAQGEVPGGGRGRRGEGGPLLAAEVWAGVRRGRVGRCDGQGLPGLLGEQGVEQLVVGAGVLQDHRAENVGARGAG